MTRNGTSYQERIAGEVAALIEPVVADLGFELVEVQFRREQHGQVLRVVIYGENGIGVDDCSRISREVSHLLDVEDIIDQTYHLEVSSPGLDRQLKTARDFARCRGQKVRIALEETSGEVTGVIEEAGEDSVRLAVGGERIDIPLARVRKARLVIEF